MSRRPGATSAPVKGGDKGNVSVASTVTRAEKSPGNLHLLIFLVPVTVALLILVALYNISTFAAEEHLKLPRSMEEVKRLQEVLSRYMQVYQLQVVLGYITVYVTMQTFAIPGTIFLSILAGALFGVVKGLTIVIFTATLGASSCFFMSSIFGKKVAFWLWPDKMKFFSSEVQRRRASLINYIIFLRITPVLPNTFINVASPIVGVPYTSFAIGTFIGLLPAGFVAVRAGLTLSELKSPSDLYDVKSIAALFLIAAVSIVPAMWSKRVQGETKQE
eukprot:jgi/Mesvir1/26945/Mv20666-RA.1